MNPADAGIDQPSRVGRREVVTGTAALRAASRRAPPNGRTPAGAKPLKSCDAVTAYRLRGVGPAGEDVIAVCAMRDRSLVPPNDAAGLANARCELLANPVACAALGASARRYVEREADSRACIRTAESFYVTVAAEASAVRRGTVDA